MVWWILSFSGRIWELQPTVPSSRFERCTRMVSGRGEGEDHKDVTPRCPTRLLVMSTALRSPLWRGIASTRNTLLLARFQAVQRCYPLGSLSTALVVSMADPAKSRMRRATPFLSSRSTMPRRSCVERASRSSRVMTNVSPSRAKEIAASSCSRFPPTRPVPRRFVHSRRRSGHRAGDGAGLLFDRA